MDEAPTQLGTVLTHFWVQNVAILAWTNPPTPDVIDAIDKLSAPRRSEYPRGMSVVHIGRAPVAVIDTATREALARLTRASGTLAAVAFVTPATGFFASAVRSVATAVMVLAGSPTENRFHERVDDVLDWLPPVHLRVTGVALDMVTFRRVLHKAASSCGM